MLSWIGYIAVGKLIIYLLMQFPLPQRIEKHWFFGKLHSCDLCLGVWVYGLLGIVLGMDMLQPMGLFIYPFINQGVTGAIIAYVVHIFFIGLKAKYEVITV